MTAMHGSWVRRARAGGTPVPWACMVALAIVAFPVPTAAAEVAVRPAEAALPHPIPPRPPARRALIKVFAATSLRNWSEAQALAARVGDPVLAGVVSWIRFTTPGEHNAFEEVATFIEAHPDWPDLDGMRASAEAALTDAIPDSRVIDWFSRHPPVTAPGAGRFASALIAAGETARAESLVRRTWVGRNFAAADERAFYRRFRRMLTAEDHVRRLDRLLWEGRGWEARRMLSRVEAEHRAAAVARMRLRQFRGGVDWAIRQVPERLQRDPGLIYERLRWRRRKGRDEDAIALLADLPGELPYAHLWWHDRGTLARRALRDGNPGLAYRLASEHRQTEGTSFADAEWLAGWIALRFLSKPALARTHFVRLHENVNYPISRSRGAYWAGRAAEALGDAVEAQAWYRRAASHATTFHGQLAAVRMGAHDRLSLPPQPDPTDEATAAGSDRDVVKAARLIALSPERTHLKAFVLHLARCGASPAEHALAATIAAEAHRPDVAVHAARISARRGVPLLTAGWPRAPLPEDRHGIERGMLLALMRQESAFDPEAVSWAGARGLMQLMPATARIVAGELDLSFSRRRLLEDPDYNMAIGAAYLSRMLDRFDGSYVLALAAYNAGPSRAAQWLRQFGDFRSGDIDVIDWIEMIPFEQTRDYVQRVIENFQVYRALLGSTAPSILPPERLGR